MRYHLFPALLRSAYGNTSQYGTARLSPNGAAIDFGADFIPLLPLGTAVSVSWVYGQTVVAEYTGKTYLSCATMLRMVEIDPALLAPTRDILASNTSLPGLVRPAAGQGAALDVTVSYLSAKTIRLLTACPAGENTTLLLDVEVDFLTLRGLALTVRRQVPLRRGEIILVCRVPPAGPENQIALTAYAARLEQLDEDAGG